MNIGIVGLGLIGGSLGIDLRSRGHQVFGVSRSMETCRRAFEIEAVHEAGVIDETGTAFQWLAQQATDVIFICTPLNQIVSTLERLRPHLARKKKEKGQTTIVTDVGSAKASIVYSCFQLWPNFIGGHPMAGTAEKGIVAAQSGLFVNKPYVLTPIADPPAESVRILTTSVEKLTEIIHSLNANLYMYSPEVHDRAVAWISHLPVMVSASLIQACMGETDSPVLEAAQNLASSGFEDTSRVGGGNPELGVLMARYNKEALLRSLHQYRDTLDYLIERIEAEDWSDLREILESTQQARNSFVK